MGSISDNIENFMLNHMFNKVTYTSPASVFLALFEGDPGETGLGGVEPVGNGYARTQITFKAPVARHILNNQVTFPQATGNWQTTQLDHYGIFDQQTGGIFMAYGALQNPIQVVNQNTPSVAADECDIWFYTLAEKGGPQNNLSDYAAEAILNHLFRNIAWLAPSTYVGYSTTNVNDDGTGITEPAGGGYARKLVNPNSGDSPKWRSSTSGVVRNQDAIVQDTPTGSWGTVVCGILVDALSLGNLLYYDRAIQDQAINANDTVRINIDQFQGYLT